MKQYDEIKNCELVRTIISLPKTPKNKGLMIILNSDNLEFTKNQILNMKYGFINYKFIKSLFINGKYRFKLFNQSIIEKIDNSDIYNEIKQDKELKIQNTHKLLSQYQNNNIYFAMYPFNNYYFERINNYKGNKAIRQYKLMIDYMCSLIPSNYNKKIMIIDLKQINFNPKKVINYSLTEANTTFQFIYSLMRNDLEYFNKLPFDILFTYGKYKLKVIPSECTPESFKLFKKKIGMIQITTNNPLEISGTIDSNSDKEQKEEELTIEDKKDITTGKIINELIPDFVYDTAPSYFSGVGTVNEIEKSIKQKADLIDTTDENELKQEVEKKINDDKELLSKIDSVTKNSYTASLSNADIKRNKVLKEKQLSIQINKEGKTLNQIFDDAKEKRLEPKKVPITTLNEDFKEMKLPSFTKEYNKNVFESDIMKSIYSFGTKRYPVYILDVKKEDTSDDFNKKNTYTIKLESFDRKRHTIKIDVPKFVNDSFLYLGGNEKTIISQFVLLPVAKTGPNTVQLCSCAYNKIFLRRSGVKVSPKIEKMKKTLSKFKGPNSRGLINYKLGDNSLVNTNYITNLEYDELAKTFMDLEIRNNKNLYTLYFNQNNLRDYLKNKNIKFIEKDNILPIGLINNKEVIYLDTNSDFIKGTKLTLIDYLENVIGEASPEFIETYQNMSVGKKYMYTQATIMKTDVPILLLLSYLEGLTTVLNKAEINYYFSDTRPVLKNDEKNNKGIIQFADGYLVYDRYPMKNSLLMNAFSQIPTKMYNYTDFDSKEVYLDIFDQLYNNRMLLNAFENFYDLFIDPITFEVLQDLNLPTGFVELVLYGNELLQDNQFVRETDISHYRLRNNEIIATRLYKLLADSYSRYRTSVGNKNPVEMTIPQDALIKTLLTNEKSIKNYSTLNPILEAEELRAVSFRGQSGMNQERAFTLDKRIFDSSMKGIIAMSTPPSGSVGITRQLALDTNVLSTRGYLKEADSLDELNSSNMFSASELMSPGTAQFDDGSRVAMTSNQTKQLVACKKFDRLLISSGAEKVIPQIISDNFVFKAKQDGKVVEVDNENKIVVVEYKDKSYDVIDLGERIDKNGNGGFYIPNSLSSDLKVNQKFKEGDILAANKSYFDIENETGDAACKIGTLAKVAMISGFFTYEDSSMPTEKLSRKMSTSVIMEKSVAIGKNSNISYICKKGSYIEVGDPLIIFDESFEDDSINKLLANMSKDTAEEISQMGKVPVKSKYSGIVKDIKVYYTIDKSEMSPTLRNTVNKLTEDNRKKRKAIEKYIDINKSDMILDPVDKVETNYGKVKGEDVGEGVLIEFYIQYEDKLGVGDKITSSSSLKTVNCKICPEGYEAYSEFRKDEEISSFVAPISYLARMTKHLDRQLFGNKVLVELKRKVAEIYNR